MRWIVGTLFTSEIHNYAYRKVAQINYNSGTEYSRK